MQNPKARIQLAEDISSHDSESRDLNVNQQPQWGKVIANLLSRNYNEALKWYNGGGEKEEEARDLNNKLYYKVTNERGFTGKYLGADKKQLSDKEANELDARGGIFTATDEKSMKTLPWVNGKYNSELANKGLVNPLSLAMNDAYNSARVAGSANHNIDEQLKIASNLKGVLNYISELPSDRRQKLLGYVSRLNQLGSSGGTQTERSLGANVGGQSTLGQSANIGLGGAGTGMEGAAPPISGKLSGSLGANASETVQTGATGRGANVGTTSRSQSLQEQQNLERAIFQELQGVIQPGEQFQQFMRLQALNDANYAAYKNIPANAVPPTWNMIPESDVYSGGSDRMIANLVNQQRNNALLAAWSKNLYQSQRDMAKSGKAFDLDTESNNFQNSELFNAINNTYKYKMDSHLKGQLVRPPKGSKMVNGRNQIITYEGE
jgi:hypothetical protein